MKLQTHKEIMMIRHIVAVLGLCVASTAYSMDRNPDRRLSPRPAERARLAALDAEREEQNARRDRTLQVFVREIETEDCGRQTVALQRLVQACGDELDLIRESILRNDTEVARGAHGTLSTMNTVFQSVSRLQSTTRSPDLLQNLFYLLCKKLPQVLENTDTRDTDAVLRDIQAIEDRVGPTVEGATALRGTVQRLVDAVSSQAGRVSVTAGQEIKNFRPGDTIARAVADAQTALKQHCALSRQAVLAADQARQQRERVGPPPPPPARYVEPADQARQQRERDGAPSPHPEASAPLSDSDAGEPAAQARYIRRNSPTQARQQRERTGAPRPPQWDDE